MNLRVVLILLVILATAAVAEAGGINEKAVFAFLFGTVFICISWYFYSQRAKPPSAVETAAATIWLSIRRLVGFVGAAFFVFASVMIGFALYDRAVEMSLFQRLGSSLFMLAMAAYCVWVAVFGQGERRTDWRDDVALHNENKRRYRWRW
jgi:hypothetical protein